MERLTTNKEVSEMSMIELVYNSCYAKENTARYRDYDMDVDARELAIRLLERFADIPNEVSRGKDFDDFMLDSLQYGTDNMLGMIAIFYKNLWAMADLRERLKEYEDLEEQGLIKILPCKVGDTVYQVQKLRKHIQPYTIISIHISNGSISFEWVLKDGKGVYEKVNGFCDYDIGKTVFLTHAEAEEALKGTIADNDYGNTMVDFINNKKKEGKENGI